MTKHTRRRYDNTDLRVAQILDAAISLAEDYGYAHITREQVAEAADCSPALVSRHMGTMQDLRSTIVTTAIAQENLNIIAQAMIEQHPEAMAAPQELRRRAAESIQ